MLLTPATGFMEQIVGRIIRIHAHKRCPLVLDLADNVGLFHGMAIKRWNWYSAHRFRHCIRVPLTKSIMESRQFHEECSPHAKFADIDRQDWAHPAC